MQYSDGDAVNVDLSKFFNLDPTVGTLLVDQDLRIGFTNQRWAEMFAADGGRVRGGASLWDVFPRQWVEERRRIVERVLAEERPIVVRHIRRGRRIQSTCHPLYGEEERPRLVLVLSVHGEQELNAADEALEVIESGIVDLGPLDRLIRIVITRRACGGRALCRRSGVVSW